MEPKKIKVLAIDDNRDNLITLEALIQDSLPGSSVFTATEGNAGIKIAVTEDPDVILLDVIMPGMDGYEFLAKVREQKLAPKATVIVLTNQGQPEDIEKVKKYSVQGYIVKASTIPSEVLDEVIKIHKSKNN